MAKAYEYHFLVDGQTYVVYAASQEWALECIRKDVGDIPQVTFIERKPF